MHAQSQHTSRAAIKLVVTKTDAATATTAANDDVHKCYLCGDSFAASDVLLDHMQLKHMPQSPLTITVPVPRQSSSQSEGTATE